MDVIIHTLSILLHFCLFLLLQMDAIVAIDVIIAVNVIVLSLEANVHD